MITESVIEAIEEKIQRRHQRYGTDVPKNGNIYFPNFLFKYFDKDRVVKVEDEKLEEDKYYILLVKDYNFWFVVEDIFNMSLSFGLSPLEVIDEKAYWFFANGFEDPVTLTLNKEYFDYVVSHTEPTDDPDLQVYHSDFGDIFIKEHKDVFSDGTQFPNVWDYGKGPSRLQGLL